jgi:hypothetical protein
MRDRNGNKITVEYDAFNDPILITDSLDRQVTIEYDFNDVAPYGQCDTERSFKPKQWPPTERHCCEE